MENLRFGKLIALNSGHNGSLSSGELGLLMAYVKEACGRGEVRERAGLMERERGRLMEKERGGLMERDVDLRERSGL